MDPLGIVRGILGVAKSLLGMVGGLRKARAERKAAVAALFEQISDCLAAVSAEIRIGEIPHGKCAEVLTYAEQLPDVVRAEIGSENADELGRALKAAHSVEGLANDLNGVEDKEYYLRDIEEAAGKFRALAHLTRGS
jgi:hypothetical protein